MFAHVYVFGGRLEKVYHSTANVIHCYHYSSEVDEEFSPEMDEESLASSYNYTYLKMDLKLQPLNIKFQNVSYSVTKEKGEFTLGKTLNKRHNKMLSNTGTIG